MCILHLVYSLDEIKVRVYPYSEPHCSPWTDVCHTDPTSGVISEIDCQVGHMCINDTLSQLPHSVSSLTLTVDKFPDTGVTFSNFIALKKLSILWKYETDNFLRENQNKLTDSGLLAGLRMLEELKISIPTTAMNDTLLLDLINLRILDLSHIKHFSTYKFASLFNGSQLENKPLESLILKRISGVGTARDRLFLFQELLPVFQASRVRILDVSENKALYLYPGLTQYLPHLEILNAHGNEIRYVSHANEAVCLILELLLHVNIKSLDITNMGEIGKDIYYYGQGFIHITRDCIEQTWGRNKCVCENFRKSCGYFFPADVNCNAISELTTSELINLNPVQQNPVRYCDDFTFLPLPKAMEVFRFSKNKLIYKEAKWNNRTRCFQPNSLTIFDWSYVTFEQSLSSNVLIGLDHLEQLDLAYSSWGYFFHDPHFLQTFPRLEILNMTGTIIGIYIKNDTTNQIFKRSTQLKELYLKSAQISSIPYGEFDMLYNLQKLDLSLNQLTEISFLVSSLWSLSLLNISYNSLHQLTANFTLRLDQLFVNVSHPINVDIRSSPFVCNCDSLSFLRWIKKTKVGLLNNGSFLCSYKEHQQMTLIAVDVNHLTSECYLIYIVTFSVTGIVVIIVSISIAVYHYRWNIRTWLLKFAHSNPDPRNIQFKYDGFVVYSDGDRQWVHNIMLDEIENVMKLKLCVHHRDFIPGDDIDEQIVKSVHNSRKTLLILTKNFLASDWCLYEMKVARNKLQAEGKDVIIPILLAELPDENMHLSVKNLLREKTYLQWETSMGGQKYFWKRLELALRGPNKIHTCKRAKGKKTLSFDVSVNKETCPIAKVSPEPNNKVDFQYGTFQGSIA